MSSLPINVAGKTSVALVEDDLGTLTRFEKVIRASASLELLCAVSSTKAILTWIKENPVDILLVDLGLPDGSGIDVIAYCRRHQPACDVMVISMFGDESNMMKAFNAGAKGYLLKDGTEDDLAMHILNLHNGGSPMSPIIARQLLGQLGVTTPLPTCIVRSEALSILSPKENEVLELVARGFSYNEIAGLLQVTINTIHTHIRNIYGKLSVSSKTEAIYEARQLGILKN
jgi:DNA-binding NarL/FixJ family response regulator